jgi:septal ring factor EnvC (AmiA/AmiB activator)
MKKVHIILFVFFVLIGQVSMFGQSKDELQRRKKQIENDIRYTNRLINETKRSQRTSTNQIVLVKKKIEQQEKLIKTISYELHSVDREIIENTKQIENLNQQLVKLKEEYAKMIYYAYLNRRNYDRMMFIMSSDNFNQAYRRIRYFQQYSSYRMRQAALINETQEKIQMKNQQLEDSKNQKINLLNVQQTEKVKLSKEEENRNKALNELRQKERELVQTLRQKEKENQDLQNAIARIIAEEIRKAEEKRLAEEKRRREASKGKETEDKTETKTPPATSKPATTISMTPEEKNLANSFSANKGKLPWPLEKGVISAGFGERNHPVLAGVVIKNNGIDIATNKGAAVRSIFDGVVSGVVNLPNGTKAVIIRHGDFLSVYANLETASVKANDRVKTRQNIGTVYTDEDEGKTELHFELWQNKNLLNPNHWIAR